MHAHGSTVQLYTSVVLRYADLLLVHALAPQPLLLPRRVELLAEVTQVEVRDPAAAVEAEALTRDQPLVRLLVPVVSMIDGPHRPPGSASHVKKQRLEAHHLVLYFYRGLHFHCFEYTMTLLSTWFLVTVLNTKKSE